MSEPIVFISHFPVKEGMVDAYRQFSRDVTARIEAEKPRTALFLAYLSESGTQPTGVHIFVFPDADSR